MFRRPVQPSSRRSLRGRIAVAVLVGALSSAGLATPAEAHTTPVDLRLSVLRLGPATAPDVIVIGRVTHAGKPVAGKPVSLQVRTSGTAAWRTAKTARTAADGSVRLTRQRLQRGKQFRVRYPDVRAARLSNVVTVPVAATMTSSAVSGPTPAAGDQVVITGSTSANLVGARVHLQLLVGAEWRSVSSSVVAADATYSVRAIATIGGDQQYRALVKAAPGRAEVAGAVQELTVYAWYRLARSPAVQSGPTDAGALVAGREVIAGMPYIDGLGQRLEQGARAVVSYDLHNRCLAFRTSYGPTSDSDPGFYGTFRARADDATVLDAQLDRGSVQTVRADVTGAGRLLLVSAAATASGDAAWGDPEVLCAGL